MMWRLVLGSLLQCLLLTRLLSVRSIGELFLDCMLFILLISALTKTSGSLTNRKVGRLMAIQVVHLVSDGRGPGGSRSRNVGCSWF